MNKAAKLRYRTLIMERETKVTRVKWSKTEGTHKKKK